MSFETRLLHGAGVTDCWVQGSGPGRSSLAPGRHESSTNCPGRFPRWDWYIYPPMFYHDFINFKCRYARNISNPKIRKVVFLCTPLKINGWVPENSHGGLVGRSSSWNFLWVVAVGEPAGKIFQGVCFHSTKRGPDPRPSRCLSSGRSRLQNFLKKKCLDECFWWLLDRSWKKNMVAMAWNIAISISGVSISNIQ